MEVDKMTVRFLAGSDIKSACAEAYGKCSSKQCTEINFNFNGIDITMKRTEDK